jgi:endonuclease V-like protein UPF0215 family
MILPIRAIKEEIRILGLDTCNPDLTLGVVARGGLYLDGVIPLPPTTKNAPKELARRIIDSTFFPELRAVMLHNANNERDSDSLENATHLPTIAISKDEPTRSRGYKTFYGNLGQLRIRTRLESTVLKKILASSWTYGRLPEPLRLAHLLATLDLPEILG